MMHGTMSLKFKEYVLHIMNYFLSFHFVKFKSDTGQVMRGDMGVSHCIFLNWTAELYHKLQVPERWATQIT